MGDELLKLAERALEGIGHDRDLEGDIFEMFGGQAFWGPRRSDGRHDVRNPVPHYTISLDAALTLADDQLLHELLGEALEVTGRDGYMPGNYLGQFIRNFLAETLRSHQPSAPLRAGKQGEE